MSVQQLHTVITHGHLPRNPRSHLCSPSGVRDFVDCLAMSTRYRQ